MKYMANSYPTDRYVIRRNMRIARNWYEQDGHV